MNQKPEPDKGIEDRVLRAKLWLRRARKDHVVLRTLVSPVDPKRKSRFVSNDSALSVYLLQQSVEKSAKSLLVAGGKEHLVKDMSHESLKVILQYFQSQLDSSLISEVFPYLSEAVSLKVKTIPEALGQLRDVEKKSARNSLEAYWKEFASIPPDRMEQHLKLLLTIRSLMIEGPKQAIPSKFSIQLDSFLSSEKGLADVLVDEASSIFKGKKWTSEQLQAVRQIASLVIVPIEGPLSEEIKRTNKTSYEVNRKDLIEDSLIPTWSTIALMLLSAFTFPHEAPTRYPARPEAPLDPLEAARQGLLGCQHYEKPILGVVAQLPQLAYLNELLLNDLDVIIEQTSFLEYVNSVLNPPEQP